MCFLKGLLDSAWTAGVSDASLVRRLRARPVQSEGDPEGDPGHAGGPGRPRRPAGGGWEEIHDHF